MWVCLCIYVLFSVFTQLCYLCVVLSSMSVSIQVDLCDQSFGVDALTSIFHVMSFKYDGILACSVDLSLWLFFLLCVFYFFFSVFSLFMISWGYDTFYCKSQKFIDNVINILENVRQIIGLISSQEDFWIWVKSVNLRLKFFLEIDAELWIVDFIQAYYLSNSYSRCHNKWSGRFVHRLYSFLLQ